MFLTELASMREMIIGCLDHIDEKLGYLKVKKDAMFDEIQEIQVTVHVILTTQPPSS